jgi:Cu(I)/Ag(I) efflux system membrane fusion protein
MSSWQQGPARRKAIVTAAVVTAAVIAALVFRRSLVGWFMGEPMAGAEGVAAAAQIGPFSIDARLSPDPARQNDQALVLSVRDRDGKPVDDAVVEVVYDMPAMGPMAEMKGGAKITHRSGGTYRAQFDLPMGGTWTLRVSLRSSAGSGSQSFGMTVGSAGLTTAGGTGGAPGSEAAPEAAAPGAIDHYTCSMHPSVRSSGPGTCPICGMNLVAVTEEQQEQGVVMIDEARRQLIGVRTEPVVQGPMRETFRAVGRVAYDESTLSDVNLKVHGWITKLFVNETGQRVARGQTLFTLYSPELYNAEQDFLLASQHASASPDGESGAGRLESFKNASRQRLHLLGLTDAQIDALAQSGKPSEDLAVPSPASGYVIEKNVVEGASIDAGMKLYRIAALNRVWVEAEVYEPDLAHVRVGQPAMITLDYLPGHAYEAKTAYVYPYLDPVARTGRVRLELANKELELRPGMYASVELSSDLGSHVQVPASAVVYTGPRRLVFVDLGGGRFRPTEVQVGTESNGMYEVLGGVVPGDVVATSAIFLIAAEARISTAAKYWDTMPESADAGGGSTTLQMPVAEPRGPSAPPSPMPVPHRAAMPAKGGSSASPPPAAPSPPPAVDYTCPMHPEVHSATPGKCPKCGMDLAPHRSQP